MNSVNDIDEKKFHPESAHGVDAVLERMWESLGKPPVSYAMALDVPDGTIKTWRKRGAISSRFMMNFAKAHGLSMDYLMGYQEGQNKTAQPADIPASYTRPHKATRLDLDAFVTVPRYDVEACAGHGAVIHSEQIVDYLAFKADWVHNALGVSSKDLALISVKGDSMEPTLSNGDLILLDMHQGKIEDNAIYALQHNSTLVVKRVQRKLDGSVVVKSDNPRYEAEALGADAAALLKVVGRVVWAGRRM